MDRDPNGGADGVGPNSQGQRHPSEADAARIAARQQGLIRRDQLLALDFSRQQIEHRLHRGSLFLVERGVYAVGHPRITPRARLRAALMSLGPAAFLTHRTGVAVPGLRPIDVRHIEVTIPGTGGRDRDGLIIHRTRSEPTPDEIRTTHDGLRHSSILRALVELAPRESPAELDRLITLAVQRRMLRLDARDGRIDLEAMLERHAGRPGLPKLKAALAAYRHPGNSNLERDFTALLERHPEIPPPTRRNVHIDVWEIDAFWAGPRVAVELDGRPYHVAAREMERDRIKDIALQRMRITPVRFTDLRVATDEPGVVGDLLHFVGG